MRKFSPIEIEILKRVQGNLPDSVTPYADIAREVTAVAGVTVTEANVFRLLRQLKADGTIRRLGATLRHQKAGYNANAMVVWNIPEKYVEAVGRTMSSQHQVSHCYWRRPQPDWPYSLYTMIHSKYRENCLATVDILAALPEATTVVDHAVLFSIKELKKTSMLYF
ncbi:Siroheme decarboxylase beta subunit [Desulfovibrionales bacterium]